MRWAVIALLFLGACRQPGEEPADPVRSVEPSQGAQYQQPPPAAVPVDHSESDRLRVSEYVRRKCQRWDPSVRRPLETFIIDLCGDRDRTLWCPNGITRSQLRAARPELCAPVHVPNARCTQAEYDSNPQLPEGIHFYKGAETCPGTFWHCSGSSEQAEQMIRDQCPDPPPTPN